ATLAAVARVAAGAAVAHVARGSTVAGVGGAAAGRADAASRSAAPAGAAAASGVGVVAAAVLDRPVGRLGLRVEAPVAGHQAGDRNDDGTRSHENPGSHRSTPYATSSSH